MINFVFYLVSAGDFSYLVRPFFETLTFIVKMVQSLIMSIPLVEERQLIRQKNDKKAMFDPTSENNGPPHTIIAATVQLKE